LSISATNFIIWTHNVKSDTVGTDCTGSCKSNNHTTTTTTAPINDKKTNNINISYFQLVLLYLTKLIYRVFCLTKFKVGDYRKIFIKKKKPGKRYRLMWESGLFLQRQKKWTWNKSLFRHFGFIAPNINISYFQLVFVVDYFFLWT
jgi:hypothetical protein